MIVRARFRPHPRGFGFLTFVGDDGLTPTDVTVGGDSASQTTDQAFVPPPLTRGLVADDLVDATVHADDRGVTADEVTLRQRPRRMLVGTIVQGPGRLVLDPDPSLASGWVRLAATVEDSVRQAVGRVAVVLLGADDDEGRPVASALVAGPYVDRSPQAIRARSAVVALGRAAPDLVPGGATAVGLDPSTAAVSHARFVGTVAGGGRGAAAGLDPSGPVPGASLVPVDRRDESCVTVDSVDTRDLDDAVAATWDGDPSSPVQVAVHIADAAGVVGIGSDADQYARTVATSAYLAVGGNAPMLDPALSEDALSLRAGEDRGALSVRMAVQADGTITDVSLECATIRSSARLSYGAVERLLDGDVAAVTEEAGERADVVLATLGGVVEAARRLGVERDGRITFEELFAAAEVTPAIVDGRLTTVAAEPHARAYRLIERLMVAANEAVAGQLVEHGVPALYRTHAGIDPERVGRLRAAVEAAGASVPALDDESSPEEVVSGQLLAEIDRLDAEGRPADRDLLVAVATGSTARASYDPDATHHRGLAAGAYTHFTSPIRRYADLTVHRQLRAMLAGEVPPHDTAHLTALARWLDTVGGAVSFLQARERGDLWSQLLDRGFLDEPEPATVTDLTVNGLRIRLPRIGVSGFVTAERALGLPDRERGSLVVDEHGLTTTSGPWRVGARVQARFVGLDDTGRPNWRLGDTAAPQ